MSGSSYKKEMTKVIHYKAGDTIVFEGQKDNGIYYIKKGIAKNLESGKLYGLSEECNHRLFGIIGSFNNIRTSTITALTDVEALVIDANIIRQDNSTYVLVNELLKECVDIIVNNENKIKELKEEIKELKNKLKITDD